MRLPAIVSLLLTLTAGTALAQQGGHIGLYSDSPGYSDCHLQEVLFVTNTVYIVHSLAISGNTAQFKIVNNWPGPLPGPISWQANLTLGDVYTGIAVTYIGCKQLPYLLGTMDFIPITATPPCSANLQVVADPAVASGSVEVVDCNSIVRLATGGSLYVNHDINDCYIPCRDAAQPSNWSRIKALYQ